MVRIHLPRVVLHGLAELSSPFRNGAVLPGTHTGVRGLVVMIVACQVMDPGSIPGERNFFCFLFLCLPTVFVVPRDTVFPEQCEGVCD